MMPRVVLIGPPGAGKTAVGESLARMLGVELRDTDAEVEKAEHRSIADIFVDAGEQHFRRAEAVAVATALAEHDGVVSLGGGAPLTPENHAALAAYVDAGGAVAFLDVSASVAVARVGLGGARPLLLGNPRQQWTALMERRRPVYESLATMTVLTDDLAPDQIAAVLMEGLS